MGSLLAKEADKEAIRIDRIITIRIVNARIRPLFCRPFDSNIDSTASRCSDCEVVSCHSLCAQKINWRHPDPKTNNNNNAPMIITKA
uniref:Uncharacterized protein n=1 Tax=Candidatus Kentrum eta TaxID=2126337 RepID=A0A450VDT7_9GAMM|nr:MAG: hypothetical protein BECKH772B_GA0070898_102972 [Candidatus Kentron sp. H]VFK02956.1 MAG: hypothetical protein BECKH772A_GA0070896_102982 [Candidatus Kentron sp. H]VFK05595.1 MAG: hypothetical protein BECKH772C_GA0070978_102852 [Candidatus Kentron sp. H]